MKVNAVDGILLLAGYLGLLCLIVSLFHRGQKSSDDFLVYRRELGTFRGALSIAAAWIWAPAVARSGWDFLVYVSECPLLFHIYPTRNTFKEDLSGWIHLA
jgi:Na+/proline symporter